MNFVISFLCVALSLLIFLFIKKKLRSNVQQKESKTSSSEHNPSPSRFISSPSGLNSSPLEVPRTVPNNQSTDSRDPGVLTDYRNYVMSNSQKMIAICMLAIPLFAIGYIFFQSVIIAAVLSSAGFYFPKTRRKQLQKRRVNQLKIQFKHAMSCIATSLSSGKSIESAFDDAYQDLSMLYPDPACFIRVEFQIISRRLANGEAIETAMLDFAVRSGLDDVLRFAEIFSTVKRTGGNLIDVMKRSSMMISEKLEIEQDIQVLISQKKFESRVLSLAPFCIVALLVITSPEYMEPLYQGVGVMIMAICLIFLALCFWWTQKIMDIKV
jgi:tight adherence protein B